MRQVFETVVIRLLLLAGFLLSLSQAHQGNYPEATFTLGLVSFFGILEIMDKK